MGTPLRPIQERFDANQRGEDHGNAKLTIADIEKIFRLRSDGLLYREIAEVIGIHKGTVGDIIRGERWGHYDGHAS
jgi:IS30 family transposase